MVEMVVPERTTGEGTRGEAAHVRVVLLGGFGMQPKATMSARALPLGQELAARGHAVTLIVPPWDYPADAGRVWDDGGVRIVNVPAPQRFGTARIVRSLVRAVRAARPDVVHLFKPKGYGGLAAEALRDVPLIVDHDDWEGAGGWNDRGLYSLPQRRLFAWQERALPRRAAHVTAASRTLQTQLWGFGVPPERVQYLPNALSPRRSAAWRDADGTARDAAVLRERLGLAGPTALLYTRFVECAPERVAPLVAGIRARVPGARLLLVGGGTAAEEGRMTRALGPLADAVTRAGVVPFDLLPAYLRAADVAVVPFADTLVNRAKCSVKTLDLLAVGQAVVATAVGENEQAIRHNETGLVVPPDDDDALADAVAALLTDPARARALGAAARARAWREQTWAVQTPALLDIYHHIARRNRLR